MIYIISVLAALIAFYIYCRVRARRERIRYCMENVVLFDDILDWLEERKKR